MKKSMNSGYELIETIHIAGSTFVLGENLTAPEPYVTWKGSGQDSYHDGHYFTTKEDARTDLLRRAIEVLPEAEQHIIAKAIVDEDLRRDIIDDYRDDLFLGDTESCLWGAARFLKIPDNQLDGLLKNQQFLSTARRLYDNLDHSYENEAYSDALTTLITDQFSYVLPNEFSAVLKISPEEWSILQDALALPINELSEKYGAVNPGEYILQFTQRIEAIHESATMTINILPKEHEAAENKIELILADEKHNTTEKILTSVDSIDQVFSITDENGVQWNVDLHADERLRRIGQIFQFHSDTDDYRYQPYVGKTCIIDRMLTKEEADILISGPMWKARFEDGTVLNVFDYELLLPLDRKWDLIHYPEQVKPIVSLSERILNAQRAEQQSAMQTPHKSNIEK